MSGVTHRCDSEETWGFFIDNCQKLQKKGEVRVFKIDNPKNRTLSQNDMKERQVKTIAEQCYDGDEAYARKLVKYYCGVPVLYAENEKFAAFCDVALKGLSEEQRIDAMEFVPVTSISTTKQMSRIIEKTFDRFAESVDWGELIQLTEGQNR